MKFVSWNVNGLRACVNKGFLESFHSLQADVFCLQETKMQPEQLALALPGYKQYWFSAQKKGYSGTAVFTRYLPLTVKYGIGAEQYDIEGRAITLEYTDFYLVNTYVPNAQQGLARIDYRMAWEDAFRCYLQNLAKEKPVIVCGDFNVAHSEIDLKNPGSNHKSAGFSDAEREKFTRLLAAGFVDSFRSIYPALTGQYSWWSYLRKARERNAGWRIDYFLVSLAWQDKIAAAAIHSEIMGSDHCPVSLKLQEKWQDAQASMGNEV